MRNEFKLYPVDELRKGLVGAFSLLIAGLLLLAPVILAKSEKDFSDKHPAYSSGAENIKILSSEELEVSSIPRPEYPRPDFCRSAWLNLNGQWDFTLDLSDSGEERGLPQGEGFDLKIVVPFAPESKLSGIGFSDFIAAAWYKRPLVIPENWQGQRIKLNFEAADYETTVWINGQKVGTHRGGYTPFSFDITDFCQQQENVLVVRCQDDVRSGRQPAGKQSERYYSYGCMYRRTTGIWQTVWLEPVPATSIDRYRVYPDLDNQQVVIQVYLNEQSATGSLTLSVIDHQKIIFKETRPAARLTAFTVKIKNPKLWQVRRPYLYDFTLELKAGEAGSTIDRIQGYFGLREIEARGERVYFNKKPLFMRLVLDQGFYPEGIYTAPTDEALRHDIEISLAAGFDGARLHQRVFERRFLYWADRLGYIVWGEFADWGLDLSRPESLIAFQAEWLEAVERDFNHPAIIGWCPFNEHWGQNYPGVMESIFRLTKALDPTRLMIDASGGYHVVEPDVYDSHNYEQNVVRFKEAYDGLLATPPRVFVNGVRERHTPYKGQPYFVSEYGGIWWNPGQQDDKAWGYGDRPKSPEEFLERYKALTEALLFNQKIAGFCYTQLYDIEQEVNGLYSFDRQPKFDPAFFFKVNQQKSAIE
ncbi:MAG TPA: glycoside hydrolase family 2 TIM barrel-domain containing protein [Candidatus Saccharicenans sp.]|mgnify:CR=1 FL=1|jgi:beta-galactosidase/beta-glucuronidase|nr:beta-galactosidase [Candidatus Saccharicenans sp.]HRD02185.1 glycoside hydrolase family 2 TIM barrel-domain containing protein [Candidatus Saccharicenans sp.]